MEHLDQLASVQITVFVESSDNSVLFVAQYNCRDW
jgi:hypothetical protein